jgi:hypothetical protein
MTNAEGIWYTVDVDVWAPVSDPDLADHLLWMLGELGVTGAVVTSGGDVDSSGESPGYGARFSLAVADEVDADLLAVEEGRMLMLKALQKAGIEHAGVARLSVMDETLQEKELEREAEQLLGVAEVASYLGVQKQRIPQLRVTAGFPAPIAELASGPVWKESSLRRFAETWARRPGRPRKVQVGTAVEKDTAGEITPRGSATGQRQPTRARAASVRSRPR